MDYPKLRNLDVFPIMHGGRQMIALRDPSGLAEGMVLLPRDAAALLELFDGERSVRDIQTELARRTGQLVFSDHIAGLVGKLDEALLLDSDRFAAHKAVLADAYLAADARPATHAGQSYPAEPDALAAQLDDMLQSGESTAAPPGPVNALVAPHIDFERGRKAYGAAYAALLAGRQATLFVVLGTAHFENDSHFIATEKPYDTPLGAVPTEPELLHALQDRCEQDLLANQVAHRQEHSIEFQAVFLRHLFPDRNLRLVAILCPSLQRAIDEGVSPIEVPQVAEFVAALRGAIAETEEPICVIAGADLSHIGQQFGDGGLSPGMMQLAEREDLAMLKCVEKLDAEEFYAAVARDGDRRHICGLTSMYVLLQAQQLSSGRLLRYEQAATRETQSMVSFAAMAFS